MDLSDRRILEQWFSKHGEVVAVAIAGRAMFRLLADELADSELNNKAIPYSDQLLLTVFRILAATTYYSRVLGNPARFNLIPNGGYGSTSGAGSDLELVCNAAGLAIDAAVGVSLVDHSVRFYATTAVISSVRDSPSRQIAVEGDIQKIEQGVSEHELAYGPVWPDPQWSKYHLVRHEIQSLGPTWMIWSRWYEAVGSGRVIYDDVDEFTKEEIDRAFLVVNKGDWEQGPQHINNLIKQRIDDAIKQYKIRLEDHEIDHDALNRSSIEIPAQQPAPLEVSFIQDRIVRTRSDLKHVGEGTSAAHRILVSEARWLRDRLKGQMPDAHASFTALIEELGATSNDIQVYGVGYWSNVIAQISDRVDESLLEDAAGRFAGFLVNLDLFLKQSPEWNAYTKNAHRAELETLHSSDTAGQVDDVVAAISGVPKFIREDVTQPLERLHRALLDASAYNPETAYGFYRSLANVLQAVAETALQDGVETLQSYAVDIQWELRRQSVSFTATTILAAVGYQIVALTGAVPSLFGFLKPLLKILGIGT